MSSKYVRTKNSSFWVSREPVPDDDTTEIDYVGLSCLTTEITYTAGAKSDIDVTTICSTEKEQINGLQDPGEITLNGNWVANDDAQKILREAYDNDQIYGFKIVFSDSTGYMFRGEVRQENFTVAPDAIVTGGFTIRIAGRLKDVNPGS